MSQSAITTKLGRVTLLVACCLLMGTGVAAAAVVPSALFSDNAVLQADRDVPVWGRDDPMQPVTVSIAGATVSGTAGDDGRWEVRLPAMKPSDAPLEMVIAGSSTVTVRNVLIGEVWLGSGQSNMEMPVDWGVFGPWGTPECMKQVNAADHPKLRMFKVAVRLVDDPPAKDVVGSWQVCTPATILKWSAAGYFFGRELQAQLGGTPVGIINASLGGSKIAPWLSRKTVLAQNPSYNAKTLEQWGAAAKSMAEFESQTATWNGLAAKAKSQGGKEPDKPKRPAVTPWPSSLYRGMIAPLAPYAIRGMAWYQGESNTGAAVEDGYALALESLVTTWREAWQQGDFPCIIVQLPNFSASGPFVSPHSKPVQADPVEVDARWPPIREAQRRTAAALPNTALLVAIDIGDPKNIHPVTKLELGRRWALLAMNLAYGRKDLVASGPLLAGCAFSGSMATATFSSVGGGLKTRGDGELTGFAIAGADGAFVWAKAVITGNTVVISAESVRDPVSVRYAWAENPIGNLINADGFPASPFKADRVATGGR